MQHAISIAYVDLTKEALVSIFLLADLLKVTPHRAAHIYITERAAQQASSPAAA